MKTIDVNTKEGILRGEDCGSIMVFRGVPYAEAPVGSMRFSAPASKKPWVSIRRALEFASICPQADPHGGFYGKEFYDDSSYPIPSMDEESLDTSTSVGSMSSFSMLEMREDDNPDISDSMSCVMPHAVRATFTLSPIITERSFQ